MRLRRVLVAGVVHATWAALALTPVPPAGADLAGAEARWVANPAGADIHWSSPAIVDVDGDGSEDVVVGGQDGNLYAFTADGRNLPGFPARVDPQEGRPTAVASSPAVGDLDGDGRNEIAVGAGSLEYENQQGGVVILNANGSVRCRFRTGDKFNVWTYGPQDGYSDPVFNGPAIADVDGDGRRDVVFGSWDHYIYAIDRNCRVIASFNNTDTVWSAPAIADVDGDGQGEVFIGGDATAGPGQPVSGGLFRRLDYNGTTTFTQTWLRTATDTFQSAPAINVVNGRLAVVTGTGWDYCRMDGRCTDSRKVWAFDVANGNDIPGWPQSMPAENFLLGPALGDVNGDGSIDVVAGSKDGTIRAFRENGATLWSVNIEDGDYVGSPVIADVNGSGPPEVVVAATPRAYVLDGATGRILLGFAEGSTGLAHKNAAAVGKLGGSWAVVTAGFDPQTRKTGWVQAFDIPPAGSAPWAMSRKNPHRPGADTFTSTPRPTTPTTAPRVTVPATTTTTTVVPTATATLTATPPLGPPGFVTQAHGTGFPPGPVTLSWDPGIGATATTAGPDGTFTAQVLVMPRDRLGPRRLVAVGGAATAVADFLVVVPTVQPSGSDVTQINRIRRFANR
ncbi:MAG TPA: FG-GAP-like repeat-containing protein [Acidimicrobiales bacterium]|nr:FG-GAP-like repeat-containing protein [Acidimicrobiales bacterium]